jgi:hypothetical protein
MGLPDDARAKTMIFIQFEAMPTQAVAARDNVAGAYVNCWIQSNDAVQAEARGRQWISDQGWIVVSVKQYRTVDVQAETQGPDSEYVLEALKADGSIVFHRWSPDSEARAN